MTSCHFAFKGTPIGTYERGLPSFPRVEPLARGLIYKSRPPPPPHPAPRPWGREAPLPQRARSRLLRRPTQEAACFIAAATIASVGVRSALQTAGRSARAARRRAPSRRRWRARPQHAPASAAGPARRHTGGASRGGGSGGPRGSPDGPAHGATGTGVDLVTVSGKNQDSSSLCARLSQIVARGGL